MATRKKTKTKAKAKKKTTVRKTAGKKASRKTTRAKVTAKKKTASKSGKTMPRATTVPMATYTMPDTEERVGIVTHYFTHLSVAIVQLDSGMLREGDVVHIKGHTSDFKQRIESMEVEHVHVSEVLAGQSFGLRVKEHAREHDVIYKVLR
jgi:translation elongation factor EF-Tu-like GTPase